MTVHRHNLRMFLALPAIGAALVATNVAAQEGDPVPQTGQVELSRAQASIDLGDKFVFYGPGDTRTILVDNWENPPSEADGVLGMVMPAGTSPRDRAWGAIVTYEDIGWVSSDDARTADYGALLSKMQADAMRTNDLRRREGYPDVSVVGWAQEPRYDSVAHSVTWGRELGFQDGGANALHYDLRLLGRYGVLSLNMVGEMDQLAQMRAAAGDLAGRTSFDAGARYDDFDEARDEAAGYGIAGLVAAGAGAAVAKNIGVFAMLAKLAQPIGIALLVLAAALATPFRRLFRRKEPVRR